MWVNTAEMTEMAEFLGISIEEFKRKYTRRVGQRYSLTERKPHYDCVFLEGKKCQVYGARPTQCKTFPWWPQNISSDEAWKETARHCEGIHDEAELVPLGKINEQLHIQLERNADDS